MERRNNDSLKTMEVGENKLVIEFPEILRIYTKTYYIINLSIGTTKF